MEKRSKPTPPSLGWTILFVDNVAKSVRFYRDAFVLTVAFEHPSGDYAEFDTGPTKLALCARSLAAGSTGLGLTTKEAANPTGNVTLVVQDVPVAFEWAVRHGATPQAKPVRKPWGQESSYVLDPDSNLVELATAVA